MIGAKELMELKKDFIPDSINHDSLYDPSIVVEDKDNLHSVDWRFAFKSTVFIRGNNTDRMIKVYELISKYLPERVFIFHNEGDQTEIIDSKGLLSGILE